jgi:hypothetical protein
VNRRSLLAGAVAALTAVGLAACGSDEDAGEAELMETRRGFALPTYSPDGYDAADAAGDLAAVTAIGGTWVQLNPTWYQTSGSADTMAPADQTVSDAGVRRMIRLARGAGLRVSLKPHVDLRPAGDRSAIQPADPDAWFAAYTQFIGHYAVLAREEGVAELVVGTELAGVSADRERWLKVVAAVRGTYAGPLVYAANFDEFDSVAFWDAVDLIGVDAYFPLADAPTADRDALAEAWLPIRDRLAVLAAAHGKPVLFTEAGYRSQTGTAAAPYSFTLQTPADPAEQAAAYAALLDTFEPQPWWAGVHWWLWTVLPTDTTPAELSYSPAGKPAAEVVRTRWGHT